MLSRDINEKNKLKLRVYYHDHKKLLIYNDILNDRNGLYAILKRLNFPDFRIEVKYSKDCIEAMLTNLDGEWDEMLADILVTIIERLMNNEFYKK